MIGNLSFVRRISNATLRRPGEDDLNLVGMASRTRAHELFLADAGNKVVRAFNVSNERLETNDMYRPEVGEFVGDVAYSVELDTLFVATWKLNPPSIFVRSFTHTNGEWRAQDTRQLPGLNLDWIFCSGIQYAT